MELTGYITTLRDDLAVAAEVGDDEALHQAIGRLLRAVDPALRLTLMQALSDAAAEITGQLAGTASPAVVRVELAGREPRIKVEAVAGLEPTLVLEPDRAPEPQADGDAATSRITLRLPEPIKAKADERAAEQGVSLNSFIVNAVRAAVSAGTTPPTAGRGRTGRRMSGWI